MYEGQILMIPPIIYSEPNDIVMFDTIEDAVGYLEPENHNNDNCQIYDSSGQLLELKKLRLSYTLVGTGCFDMNSLFSALQSYKKIAFPDEPLDADFESLFGFCYSKTIYNTWNFKRNLMNVFTRFKKLFD